MKKAYEFKLNATWIVTDIVAESEKAARDILIDRLHEQSSYWNGTEAMGGIFEVESAEKAVVWEERKYNG